MNRWQEPEIAPSRAVEVFKKEADSLGQATVYSHTQAALQHFSSYLRPDTRKKKKYT